MSFFRTRSATTKKDDQTEIHTNPLKKLPQLAAQQASPTEELSEQEFIAFLEEMNIPKAQYPMMMNMPLAQKKLLLSQQKTVTKQAQVDDTPQYFVSKLKAEPNMKNLETVSVFIRSKPKSWIIDFIAKDGLDTLFSILAQNESKSNKTHLEMDLQAECIRCFYGIMNIPEGFRSVVHSKDSAKRIALNLDSSNIGMKLQVMRLLAGICLLDDSGVEDGHKLILDAFDNFKLVKRTKLRFSKLVDDLAASNDHDYRNASLIMINAIVNKRGLDLNTRVALRKELETAGLPDVLQKVKEFKDADELYQIDIYEESALEDQEELDQIAPVTFDTNDVNAVFQNILRTATEADAHGTVLRTLHHILRVPSDKKKMYAQNPQP